jgi:hypothetical protein
LLVQGQQLHVQLDRALGILCDGGLAQLGHVARRDVGGDADVAVAAHGHQVNGRGVVTREDGEALGGLLD